jgi:hypothetical protein
MRIQNTAHEFILEFGTVVNTKIFLVSLTSIAQAIWANIHAYLAKV